MLIYAPDQLPRSIQNQPIKRQTAIQNVAPTKFVTKDKKQENSEYAGERRRHRDRREQSLKIAKERRQIDRRSRHLRTPKRIRIFIDNSENPTAPGANHDRGDIINEKV
ncbi:MAG: hypothetical protein JKY67_08940 [Pseudomonadales bacterium]|nr:hypothetical protein [Pseudomonadales bacterium]